MKIPSLLSLLIFSCVFLLSCNKTGPIETSLKTRPVKTLTLGAPNVFEKHRFPAVVDAFKKADLSFRVSGKVESIDVKEGDIVNAGDTLATLDQADFNIKLNSAEADFTRAKADYNRAAQLVEKGHVSRTDFDKLEALYRIAESNVQAAQKNLAYTVLKAPFTGTIAKRYIENFEDVSSMSPILSLHDVSLLTIKVNIPESIMIRQNRERTPPKIYAEFENIPGETFPLTIQEVSTQADAQAGTYRASLLMEVSADHNILPGMSAIVTGQRDVALNKNGIPTQTFIVPPIAVSEDAEGRFVYLAKPTESGTYRVVKQKVSVGSLFQSGLELTSGVARGQHIIVAGVSHMREGLEVNVIGDVSL